MTQSVATKSSTGKDLPAGGSLLNQASRYGDDAWWMVALLALLAQYLWQLKNFWGNESYYNYGFTVPILAIVLFFWRWRDAPPVVTSADRQRKGLWIALGIVLALVPFRMLGEVNPFWRVPILFQSVLLLCLACVVFWIRGGREGLRHFIFPILFLLTMVPWPYRIEVTVIQGFTQQVMRLTEAALLFLGHPAEQSGNSLLVGGEKIDVNDACSGIRSIQALSMSALLLGELFRLSLLRRVGSLVFTVGLVLFFNSARALALTLLYLRNGYGSYAEWHDRIGWISFVASLAVLYLICEWLKQDRPTRRRKQRFQWGTQLVTVGRARVVFAVSILSLVFSEGWFLVHELNPRDRVPWTLDWEAAPFEPQPERFVPSAVEILNFDYGETMAFDINERRHAQVFVYGYTGEDRVKSVSSYGHSPIICMAASGIPVKEQRSPLRIHHGDFDLSLQHYVFGPSHIHPRGDLHSFWLVWESRFSDIPPEDQQSLNYRTQLKLLAEGRRDYARQVLLVSVAGARSPDEARDDARRLLEPMLQPASGALQ